MKAAVFEAIGQPLALRDVAVPTPNTGEVLLRVERCGICGSDLHMTEDPIFCIPGGTILGHEFAATVVERGPGCSRLDVGDRVAVIPIRSCGACEACLGGEPARCAAMQLTGGGYAEYVTAHEQQCVTLPDTLSAEDGALVEPMAVGLHGVRLSGLRHGDRVAVIGAGPIGLAVAYWCRRFGARTVGVTASSRQREDLAGEMGADLFIDPDVNADPKAVADALGGAPDIVFECVGKPGLIDRCIRLVRPRGTVVVLGLCTVPDRIDPFLAVNKEVRLQMSAFYTLADFETAATPLDLGRVSPRAMITDQIDLASLPATFEQLRHRSTRCKVLVRPNLPLTNGA